MLYCNIHISTAKKKTKNKTKTLKYNEMFLKPILFGK